MTSTSEATLQKSPCYFPYEINELYEKSQEGPLLVASRRGVVVLWWARGFSPGLQPSTLAPASKSSDLPMDVFNLDDRLETSAAFLVALMDRRIRNCLVATRAPLPVPAPESLHPPHPRLTPHHAQRPCPSAAPLRWRPHTPPHRPPPSPPGPPSPDHVPRPPLPAPKPKTGGRDSYPPGSICWPRKFFKKSSGVIKPGLFDESCPRNFPLIP
jgi:hypothetical protein